MQKMGHLYNCTFYSLVWANKTVVYVNVVYLEIGESDPTEKPVENAVYLGKN